MKRTLCLSLVVLSLASGAALAQNRRAIPLGCKEDFADCKEDCTIEHGGSTRTYKQLTACLAECSEKQSMCRERHYTARESGLAPGALDTPRERDPAMQETPYRSSTPAAVSPAASSSPEPLPASSEDTGRRGVYRASQEEKKPVADPEVDTSDDEPSSAELPPPPPPKAEVKPAAAPKAEPEVKPAVLKEPEAQKPTLAEKPAMKEKPVAAPAPEPDEDEVALPPPPPPSAMKPKPATSYERPALPPEPKKDISEWDPNGD